MPTEVIFAGTGPAVPPPGRGHIAFVVRDGTRTLLFEAGPLILPGLQRIRVAPGDVQILLLSHRHGDHTLGFPMLMLDRLVNNDPRPLCVVAGASLRPVLTQLVGLVYPEALPVLARVEWVELDESGPGALALASDLHLRWDVACGPQDVPVLAMRLEFGDGRALVYSGDTMECRTVVELARGADLLIHEATYSVRLEPEIDPRPYSHSTAREAALAARAAGVGELALVHLSSQYAGREGEVLAEAREVFGGTIVVPADGDVLRI